MTDTFDPSVAYPCLDGADNCPLPHLAQQLADAFNRGDDQAVDQLREQMTQHLVERHK